MLITLLSLPTFSDVFISQTAFISKSVSSVCIQVAVNLSHFQYLPSIKSAVPAKASQPF